MHAVSSFSQSVQLPEMFFTSSLNLQEMEMATETETRYASIQRSFDVSANCYQTSRESGKSMLPINSGLCLLTPLFSQYTLSPRTDLSRQSLFLLSV